MLVLSSEKSTQQGLIKRNEPKVERFWNKTLISEMDYYQNFYLKDTIDNNNVNVLIKPDRLQIFRLFLPK